MATFDDAPNNIPDCEKEIERIKNENYKIKLEIAKILDSGHEPRNLQVIFDKNEAKILFLQEKIKLMIERCKQRALEEIEKRHKKQELKKHKMFALTWLGVLTVITIVVAVVAALASVYS